ncbi:MAG: crossover junction endodeoxyribonuclease RuvC [Chloroflexota bacterium]|nr:crossover junction endodeoxyribonuclease RuvC [Chloroflexota bacterium]
MTRILGIDPGLNATGWGLLEIAPDGAAGLRWGTIRPPDGPLSERLNTINWNVRELVERHRPDSVAIERPFNHRNVKTAVTLGQAQAAAMIAAAAAAVPVHEYPPRQVKEAVAGLGSADKPAVKQALMARLGLAELDAPADAADALAVAYCHHLMTPVAESLEIQ